MPEQLTKHPEVTLQVLRSAGAKCGEGASQSILTQCPAPRFCKLQGGEVCVYGLAEAPRMTQISATEWQSVLRALEVQGHPSQSAISAETLFIGGIGVLIGFVLAFVVLRLKRHLN